MKMSKRIIKGDIFKVLLKDGIIRYFQFIGRDRSELNGDVIVIFKKQYDNESNDPETITSDEIECFMHTSLLAGIKLGLWEKVHSLQVRIRECEVFFKESQDEGLYPRRHFVSHHWVVWAMNADRLYVGTLPEEYYNTDLGGIYAPIHVIYRLETGERPDRFYPDYR